MVYAAFDQERPTHVALKTLTSLDASSLYRLKKEFSRTALQPDVPRDLDALCARLLERNAESRPTIQELCDALGADAFFHARGAVDPEHLVATLIPGCGID
jgi:hypothetical protein